MGIIGLWRKENPLDVGAKILLFFVSPFLGFIYSLYRLNTKSSYWISFLAALFYGLCMVVGIDRSLQATDCVSYRLIFESYDGADWDQFLTVWSLWQTQEATYAKDLYSHFLAYLVSRFSNNYHMFFLCAAAVFSYFQLRSFRFFTGDSNFTNSLMCLLLSVMFLLNGIANVNGLRFWTTAWVAVYASLQIFGNGKMQYILLAAVTPIMHSAYWVYIAVVVISLMFGGVGRIWKWVYWLSIFLSVFSSAILLDLSPYLPEVLASSIETYTSGNIADKMGGIQTVFFVAFTLFINITMLVLMNTGNCVKNTRLFNFTFIFLILTNVNMLIPALGVRFQIVMLPFVAYLWLHAFGDKRYSVMIAILPVVFAFRLFAYFQLFLDTVDYGFFYQSPIRLCGRMLINY